MKMALIFGQDQSVTKKAQGRGKGKASGKKSFASYMMVDSNILWSDIQEFAKAKYDVSCVFIICSKQSYQIKFI